MRQRNPRAQSQHDAMVRFIAEYMLENGFHDIRADIRGFPQPGRIYWARDMQNGHIPDATGVSPDNVPVIIEVETADTIAIAHTASQWRLFAAFAESNNEEFHVAVPKGSGQAADAQLQRLGLTAYVLEVTLPSTVPRRPSTL